MTFRDFSAFAAATRAAMPPPALAEVTFDQFTLAVAAELTPSPHTVAAIAAIADALTRRFITDMTLLTGFM